MATNHLKERRSKREVEKARPGGKSGYEPDVKSG